MKKKNLAALTLAIAMGATCLTGCELVTTNNQRDMAQIVAEVDISKSEDFSEGGEYAQYADMIDVETVDKRQLVAYFVNVGYQYVQSGYSYSDTFDLLMTSLINQKIVSQYAKVYYMELAKTNDAYSYSIEEYKAYVDAAEDKDIASYAYFLTEDEYAQTVYSLEVSINEALDSYEKSILSESGVEEETSDVTVRTLPTGVNTDKEDYYDGEYAVYTGRNAASSCGSYETVEGSTPTTRKKAYNRFLKNLKTNYLYDDSEQGLALEDLAYYKTELMTRLSSALISKFADTIEEEAEKNLSEEYVTARYNELLESQRKSFNASQDTFETALDGLSDTSFVLYAPDGGFGFVINILLPFSTTQSYQLEGYKSDTTLTSDELYAKRAVLLRNVVATDQRETWFTGEEDYSFESDDAYQGSGYLFFKESLSGEGRYEKLEKYYGKYAYNGKVVKEDGEYKLTPNKVSVDDFIDIFEGYVSYATGETPNTLIAKQGDYYTKSYVKEDGTVDYSEFVYYAGKFDVGFDANSLFEEGTASYNAFSAVNELSFAYNTDTAGLNGYLGYVVSAYDTSYVKEFEYAAKYAVEQGAGTYVVAPSDYGWHVMYCTYTFDEGEIYTFDYADVKTEGTFSYYFYEALKSSTAGTATNAWETRIVNRFNSGDCVNDYVSRYQDLKDLDG